MTDLIHLHALELRLSHEREYLRVAKTEDERELRTVWIVQIQREIDRERDFVGGLISDLPAMTDDELLKELGE